MSRQRAEGDPVPAADGTRGAAVYYFVGGPTEGNKEAFFRRLEEIGGLPRGWRIYPHASGDGRALHLVEAGDVHAIVTHLAQFGAIYEVGPIVEIESAAR